MFFMYVTTLLYSLILNVYLYHRTLFFIVFNVVYILMVHSFTYFLGACGALMCVSVYADDASQNITPGLLDKFVDRSLSDFWWLMNHGVPCSPNFDLDKHTDISLYSVVKDSYPTQVVIPVLSYEPPYGVTRFGFEEIYLYTDRGPDFMGFKTTYIPTQPTATALDFADYMLGRPRTAKEIFELLGFALSAFCGGKALEAYCLQHGYFRLL